MFDNIRTATMSPWAVRRLKTESVNSSHDQIIRAKQRVDGTAINHHEITYATHERGGAEFNPLFSTIKLIKLNLFQVILKKFANLFLSCFLRLIQQIWTHKENSARTVQ